MKQLILIIALTFLPAFAFAEMPAFPMAFWGDVSVDGVAAPAGSIVRVYAGPIEVGQVVLQENGVYGYTESTKQKLVVEESSGTLTFSVQATSINGDIETQGIAPVTHKGFVSGETIQKDLAFVTKTSSSGGSSGGGGGGSSKKKTVVTTELVKGVATSTPVLALTEEEKKIELQMQLIQLLTQLIVLLKLKLSLVSV